MMSEANEQKTLIKWCELSYGKYPELKLLFHCPNERGSRNIVDVTNLKKMGVKSGVPDLILPIPKGKYHALFIEMKSANGKVSENQEKWLKILDHYGYKTSVCYSWEQAKYVLLNYLQEQ